MRRKEGYHRLSDGIEWRPNARQREVLDLLADGRTNPEIAAALSITVDGAKWHVGELLTRTGLDDRRALAAWWTQAQSHRRQPAIATIVLAARRLWPALSLSLIVLAVLFRLSSAGDEAGPKMSSDALADFSGTPQIVEPQAVAQGPPPPCDLALPADFRSVSEAELLAQGLVELDDVDILESTDCPLMLSNRADRSIAWLSDGALIANEFMYQGHRWELVFGQLVEASATGPVIRRIYSPVLSFGEDGIFLIVQALNFATGEVRRVAFDSQGRLYIGPSPLPDDAVVEAWTGDTLDITDATRLARLKPGGRPAGPAYYRGFYLNSCGGTACRVSYSPGDTNLLAPVGGTLRCLGAGEAGATYDGDIMELDAGGFILRFEELDTAGGPPATRTSAVSCEERTVGGGELIGLHYHYGISSRTSDGLPLSVAASEDSTLYVGEFTNALGCPCSQGN